MILVVKNNKVIAYHGDNQEDVIKDKYPGELIKIADSEAQFDEEGWPRIPQGGGIKLNKMETLKQRVADLEVAVAAILGK